ncbi:MAG TPA: hypothetical protein PK867_20340, partial [Pirellulales bacterium]|nr:hypothetical protein [Pirellulales bacterium]
MFFLSSSRFTAAAGKIRIGVMPRLPQGLIYMTSLTLDSEAACRFDNLADVAEIRDTAGRVLGYFHPWRSSEATVCSSPFSDEALRERQQQRTGKPL